MVRPVKSINHATLSRADMQGRAIGGRDEAMLDMTGQTMTVRVLSEADMAQAPFAPRLAARQPPSLAARQPPPPTQAPDLPVHGSTYTYGVPAETVQRMTAEEQVMAQSPTVTKRPTDADS